MSLDMSCSSIIQPAEPKTFEKERSSLNSLLWYSYHSSFIFSLIDPNILLSSLSRHPQFLVYVDNKVNLTPLKVITRQEHNFCYSNSYRNWVTLPRTPEYLPILHMLLATCLYNTSSAATLHHFSDSYAAVLVLLVTKN